MLVLKTGLLILTSPLGPEYSLRMSMNFTDYLVRCVGLCDGTSANYSSAAQCITDIVAPNGAAWPEEPSSAVAEYMRSRGRSWRRTIESSWKHYRDYCGVEKLPMPPTLESLLATEMPPEVRDDIRRLVHGLGVQTVQRLRWAHVDSENGRLLDYQGSILPRSVKFPRHQLLQILHRLHTWGTPQEMDSPLVPDAPGSMLGASRKRLRDIERQSLANRNPAPPPIPKIDGINAQILPGGFAAPPPEALVNLPPSLLTPAERQAGAATGRPVRSLEEIAAKLNTTEIPAWMASGLQAEITGSYPETNDEDDD